MTLEEMNPAEDRLTETQGERNPKSNLTDLPKENSPLPLKSPEDPELAELLKRVTKQVTEDYKKQKNPLDSCQSNPPHPFSSLSSAIERINERVRQLEETRKKEGLPLVPISFEGVRLTEEQYKRWPKGCFIVTIFLLRTGLFAPREKVSLKTSPVKGMQEKLIWSTAHFTVKATGLELNLNDRDVLLAMAHLYFRKNLGGVQTICEIDILRFLKKTVNGKNRAILKSSVLRLATCILDVRSTDYHASFFGRLIHLQTGSYQDGKFQISFDSNLEDSLKSCTFIEIENYLSLPSSSSKSLWGYLASCKVAGASTYFSLGTYQKITGISKEIRRLRNICKNDLKAFQEKGLISNFEMDKDVFTVYFPDKKSLPNQINAKS